MIGRLVEVEVVGFGTALTVPVAAGATVLPVAGTGDFPDDAGSLLLGGSTYDYVAVGDVSITLAAGLDRAYDESTPVSAATLDGSARVEWKAWVRLEDHGKPAPALIETPMRGWFRDGIVDAGSLVEVELVGGGYRVRSRPMQEPAFGNSVRLSDSEGGNAGGVDGDGNVTASVLSYQAEFQASAATMLIDGVPYAAQLAAQPSGIIRFAERDPLVAGIQTEYGILNVDFATETDRNVSVWCVVKLAGAVTSVKINLRLRHATSTTAPVSATSASTEVLRSDQVYTGPAVAPAQSFEFSHTMDLPAGWHSLWLSVQPTGGNTVDTAGVARVTVQDQGPPALVDNGAYRPAAPGTLYAGGTDGGSTASPAKRTYTRRYDATTTNWWEGNGTYRPADNQYTGQHSGEGNRKAAVWFNEGKIRSDLQGATVLSARVRLGVWDGGNNITLVVGSHKTDSPTQNYSAITGTAPDRTRKTGVREGTLVWVDLPFELAGWHSTLAGLLVGPGPTNSGEFACSYRGVGHANRPVLEITFEK